MGPGALALLAEIDLATRVVVRYLIDGGATDVLGYLRARTLTDITIESRRGMEKVPVGAIIAARVIPEPPSPRAPRR